MKKEKKKWETPKLICLYRGRPEEAVLAACKGGEIPTTGPQTGGCRTWQGQQCAVPNTT